MPYPIPTSPRRGRPRPLLGDRAGVTLAELLAVLVLVGVLTGLAAPRVDLPLFQLSGAMERAGTTLVAAQRRAVMRGHNVVVAVDAASTRLRVHDDANNDLQIQAGEGVRYEPFDAAVRFGRGGAPDAFPGADSVTFRWKQTGLPAVVFYRNGSASEEGGFYLTSRRSAASAEYARDTRAVRIERSTGRPSWYRYSPPAWTREF